MMNMFGFDNRTAVFLDPTLDCLLLGGLFPLQGIHLRAQG